MHRPLKRILVSMGAILILSGCAVERLPLVAYYQYDYPYAMEKYRERVSKTKEHDEKNAVLGDLHLASVALAGGDYMDAEDALEDSYKIMQNLEVGAVRGSASMALAADLRYFKGEPYERATAYAYLGLLYYRKGDFDNARAAFNTALLADRATRDESSPDYRDDFTFAHYMLGKTYLKFGEEDNATISFGKVKKYEAENIYADPEKQRDSNFTLIIALGCGPYKTPMAFVQTVDVIRTCPHEERYAKVYLDNELLGRSYTLEDLNHEADTVGASGRDTVQAVKGTIIAVARNIPLFGSLIGAAADISGASKADLRHWRMLPGKVDVVEAKVPPGDHTIHIKFFNAADEELERYQQVYHHVRVPEANATEGQTSFLYFLKSGVDRHNVHLEKSAEYLKQQAMMRKAPQQSNPPPY